MASENLCKPTEFKNGSSESQETEQDSDSIWSTASENRSDADSDVISTESVSHEMLTVRDKADGQFSDIQQLISDAESLALERRTQSLSICSPVASTPKPHALATKSKSSKSSKENKCVNVGGADFVSQPSFETDDSGYYGKPIIRNENTSATILGNCESNDSVLHFNGSHQDFQNRPKQEVSSFNNYDSPPGEVLPVPPIAREHFAVSETLNSKPRRIPLDHITKEDSKCLYDGKLNVTKDVKEVCNSSIKESHETFDSGPPVQKMHLDISANPHGSAHCENLEAKKVSSIVHDECSNLLRLALTSTSSFGQVMRLLRQVMTLQFANDTPRVADNVCTELEDYEKHHRSLEGQLKSASAQLQVTLGQVQALESSMKELQNDTSVVGKIASQILGQVEETLASCGLHHMVAVTSPRRRSIARTLEDVVSTLPLILGELNRKMAHCKNLEGEVQSQENEIEELRKSLLERESRLLSTGNALEYMKAWSSSEISSLKHCLAQAEGSVAEIRNERDRSIEMFKRQSDEDKAIIRKIQKQLTDIQHISDSRVSSIERSLQDATKEKMSLESSLQDLKNKLTVQEQQMNLINEENMLLVNSLRSTIKHQQEESEQVRIQLDQIIVEKQNAFRRSEDLASELSKEQEVHQSLQEEASSLRAIIIDLKQELSDCEKSLHEKIDNITAARSDLGRELRSRSLTILQLQTEIQMDRQRIAILSQDNESLLQKVQNLQERIGDLTRRRRHGSNNSNRSNDDHLGVCGTLCGIRSNAGNVCSPSLLTEAVVGHSSNQKIQSLLKDITDGQSREEHLHKLLKEKDETIQGLQNSLSTEMAAKNKELELLRCTLTDLENQMETLHTGFEVSAAIGNVSTEVGRFLQERKEHIDTLSQSSLILQDEFSMLASENHMLRSELSAAKQANAELSGETSEATRRAKEEARQERMKAARLEEKCYKLQAKLDSTVSTLEHEREERQMRDMLQQFKHQDFEAVLDNAVSPGTPPFNKVFGKLP